MILAIRTRRGLRAVAAIAALGGAIVAARAQEAVFADRVAALAAQFGKSASNGARQTALVDARLETTRNARLAGGNANGSSLAFTFNGAPVNGATSEEQAKENAAFDTANHIAPEKERRTHKYGLWFGGNVTLDAARSTESRLATTFSDGVVIGGDMRLSPNILIGNAFGGAFDRVGVGTEASQRSRFFSDALYGTFFTSMTSYVDTVLGVSRTDFASTYGSGASGRRDANRVFGNIRYSRVFRHRDMEFVPYGKAVLAHMALDDYFERGAGLFCPSQVRNSFDLAIGMRSQATVATSSGSLRPHADLALSRGLKSGYRSTLIAIADPDRKTTVSAEKDVSAGFAATAGIDWTISKRATAATLYTVSASMAEERPRQSLSARFTLRF